MVRWQWSLGALAGAALAMGVGTGAVAWAQGAGEAGPAGQAPGGQATAGQPRVRHIEGKVKSIDSKALTLSDGKQIRLTDQTHFLREGQTISRQDIRPGDEVRAAFEPRGNLAYATTIEVRPQGQGGQQGGGGAGTSGQSGGTQEQGGGSSPGGQ